jgi:Fe-S cluster assembly iron-binding protein IscA
MGLALDEPRDGDQTYQLDGLDVVIDPFALKIINDSGGLSIKNTLFGPSAELEGAVGCG